MPQLPGLCQSLRQVRHTELFHNAQRSCSFRAFRRRSQGYVTRTVPPRSICRGYVRVATTSPPQTTYPRMLRTSRPPRVIAVSFRSMRSRQLPMGGEPRTPPQQRPLLTIDEAATYLNVPARWVADAVRQRKVRCTRIGKHIRFRVEHLDELVAAGEQPVTSDVTPIQRNRTRSKP